MESLFNYGSDEENDTISTETKVKSDQGEQDVNYDNITMDMSEDSTSTTDPQLTSRSGSVESNSSTHDAHSKKNEDTSRRGSKDRKRRSRSNDGPKNRDRNDRKRSGREDHHRERDRDRDRDRDRVRERDERHRYRRSRSPPTYRHDRRRSRSPRDRSKYSRRDHSPPRRHRDRSPRRGAFDRKPSKLSRIELKIPEAVEKDGPGLPSYYNPVAMNPAKYAEQVAKRKLLWSSTKGKSGSEAGDTVNNEPKGNLWQGATFSQDQDGKMTAKFQRLMGIKQQSQGESSRKVTDSNNTKDLIKKQEELFSSMELQYEVARAATHTQRGVGLGFGVHHYPR